MSGWKYIFTELDRDLSLVKIFIRDSRKQHKIPAGDLDNTLESIKSNIRDYVEVSASGTKFF